MRMDSAIKSRPNHYELLGIAPSAAGDAIAKAFARATSIFRPHMFGGITELCVAYETLRDPARRRAYDASLGLPPKPIIQPVSRPASAHFMQQPVVSLSPPALPAEPQRAAPAETPVAELSEQRPQPVSAIDQEPGFVFVPRQAGYPEAGSGYRPIEWKRTGVIVGGLVAAAVLVGALTGWWSLSSPAEPEPAALATGQAPEEKAPPNMAELWGEPSARTVATQTVRPYAVPTTTRRRVERLAERATAAETAVERQLVQPPQNLAESSDPLAPAVTPAVAPAGVSNMPLPHTTVARTLDRIGYRCGNVASATPVEGSAGTYTVACTSGQSFQAKPVNGRYRFRRVARN